MFIRPYIQKVRVYTDVLLQKLRVGILKNKQTEQ